MSGYLSTWAEKWKTMWKR